jgi:hypothetical protein
MGRVIILHVMREVHEEDLVLNRTVQQWNNGAMRLLQYFFLFALQSLLAQTAPENDAIATVQKLFDGMAAHDAAIIRSAMLPDARLYSAREQGTPASRTGEEFAAQIGSVKGDLLERFTSRPSVWIRGRMAQVWGEYEFLRDGKFTHCGVDSVSLFKTDAGWKIATIIYTMETAGCKSH